MLDLTPLRAHGISVVRVGAHPQNFGYPSGTKGQCQPTAMVWHITASSPSPGPNPLAGLDSWFNNPTAHASTQLGISGEHVHVYLDWDTACYGAGYMASPDLASPYVKDWWERRQNPNFFTTQIEVVAQPGPVRVRPGEHLIDDDTWRTMLLVDEELHAQLGLPRTLDAHLGHGQIDGVNRARDPFTVYLPSDIYHDQDFRLPEEEEDDMAYYPIAFVKKATQETFMLNFANGTRRRVTSPKAIDEARAAGFAAPGPTPVVGDELLALFRLLA